MKRSILRALALCLTTAFAAGSAWAQDDNKSNNRPLNERQPAYSSGTRITSPSTQAGQPVRLTKLINANLKGQAGESLGQVQDAVVDPVSGQIQFVVLQLDGSAAGARSATSPGVGISSTANANTTPATSATAGYGSTAGGNLVAIPWRLLSYGSGDQFTATVDRARLQAAPTFSGSSWPTMDSAWMQRVYSHFGVDATGAPGTSNGTSTGTERGTGLGNPSTPGVPATPGTPDLNPPPSARSPGTGTGIGTGAGTKPKLPELIQTVSVPKSV